jgi:hypothetical protein
MRQQTQLSKQPLSRLLWTRNVIIVYKKQNNKKQNNKKQNNKKH